MRLNILKYFDGFCAGVPAFRLLKSVSSTMMTASTPFGMGAPVMMRAASPCASVMLEDDPAGISATTLKVRGDADVAFATSLSMTAKPSTDELSKGGRSDEMMSAASTRPAQALREDISVSTGLKWERMRCCASCTLSKLMTKAGALYHALCSLKSLQM